MVLNWKTTVTVSAPNRHQSKMLKKYSLSPNEESNYSEETFDSVYPAKDLLEHLASSSRTAKRVVSRFSEYLRGPVLEVGGGVGQISDELIRSGHSVTVLEPDETLFENLAKRFSDDELIDVVRGTVGTLQKNAIFGSAIYINVLEHIADDKEEIRRVSKFLVPNGTIVVFSPALPSLYGTMDGLSRHFRRYSKDQLISTLKSAGFEPIHVEYFDSVGIIPYLVAYRFFKIRTIGGGGMFLYDNIILPLSTQLARLTRGRLIGKNLLIIGKKTN